MSTGTATDWGIPINVTNRLPRICSNGRQLPAIAAEALAALQRTNDPPVLFARAGWMVAVVQDEKKRHVIAKVTESALRGRLARSANYFKIGAKGDEYECTPPIEVVRDIQALEPSIWSFEPLDGIVEAPILRPDGSILDRAGYDRATLLYYAPDPALRMPYIAERPTRDHIGWARNLLDQAIGEFPFVDVDQASKTNAIAVMLTAIVKPAIDAPAPMALLDAPQAGTGKSLLADVISIIATGRPGEMFSAPAEDEEWRKQITMALMSGTSVVVIDNVRRPLDNPDLCKVLTETLHADRAMCTHEKISLPVKSTWLATGNNIQLAGDMPRRCYWVRLDAKMSRPFTRSGFKIEDLKAWTSAHRGDLLASLLTLARAWYVAGRPKPDITPLGGYEAWSTTVGGILRHAGLEGFLGNADELYQEADPEAVQWEAFLETLDAVFYSEPFTVSKIYEKLKATSWNGNGCVATPEAARLREALPDFIAEGLGRDGFFQRRTGKCFAERVDKRFGESQVHLKRDTISHGCQQWKVVRPKDGKEVA